MDGKARRGQWVLIALVLFFVVSEGAMAVLSLQAGRFKGAQIGRVLLTGWLLWQIWDGAAWARQLMTGLLLLGVALTVVLAVAVPAVTAHPGLVALCIGVVVIGLALAIGLMSPWVGAYQAARRAGRDAPTVS
ncbi:hypothetical protein [Frigoriglobus tundricola]|uniref:Uncharacterized protein n=1 Tax=Frigoriglobus tundricola TaxID=2774151 RepID=A0A6M5YXJ6_9BACT|nr:hypothetical protein [Frigoriglobus tundricola]QJW98628.1 hypothetical protein FTUN_6223 [Frigoriglobus tundricola]